MTTRARSILMAVAVLALIVSGASPLWAESGVPDPANPFPELIDPNAKGTKLSGFITIAYDGATPPQGSSCGSFLINNMFVVLTLGLNSSQVKPFNADYTTATPGPDCFDNTLGQEDFIKAIIRDQAIPFFFGPCGGAGQTTCPGFAVKSITQFATSGRAAEGAITAQISIAVK